MPLLPAQGPSCVSSSTGSSNHADTSTRPHLCVPLQPLKDCCCRPEHAHHKLLEVRDVLPEVIEAHGHTHHTQQHKQQPRLQAATHTDAQCKDSSVCAQKRLGRCQTPCWTPLCLCLLTNLPAPLNQISTNTTAHSLSWHVLARVHVQPDSHVHVCASACAAAHHSTQPRPVPKPI